MCNQRTGGGWGGDLQRGCGNIFSVHLTSRASSVLMSKEGSKAGVLVAAASHHSNSDSISQGWFLVPGSRQQMRKGRQDRAVGAAAGTPALLRSI